MAFRVHINGVLVECETAVDVLSLTGPPAINAPKAAAKEIQGNGHQPIRRRPRESHSRAIEKSIRFLGIVGEAGTDGVSSEKLIKDLGLSKKTGSLGGVITPANRLLKECGFTKGTVYKRRSDAQGQLRWVAGKRLKECREAFEKLEEDG